MKKIDRWWLLSVASLVGTVLNIRKLPCCFAIWIVTNVAWTIRNSRKRDYPQAVLYAVYVVLSIVGLIRWLNG